VDNTQALAAAGAVVGGYFVYTRWWLPMEKQREAEAKARAAASSTKGGYQEALTQIGAKACQDVAAVYHVPAAKSAGACYLASKLATVATVLGTKLTIKAAEDAGHELGKAASALNAASSGKLTVKNALVKASVDPLKLSVKAVEKLKFWGLEGLHC
jgi:hypothetical protein